MTQQIHETKNVGYATRITPEEANQACLGCANKFSTGEKVYRMHKDNGTTVQCSSMKCFEKQGGKIDEYQINTIVSPKKSIPSKDELEIFTLQEAIDLSKMTLVVKKQLLCEPNPPPSSVLGSVVWVRVEAIYTQWKLKENSNL